MIFRPLFEVDFACSFKSIPLRRIIMGVFLVRNLTLHLRNSLFNRIQSLILILPWTRHVKEVTDIASLQFGIPWPRGFSAVHCLVERSTYLPEEVIPAYWLELRLWHVLVLNRYLRSQSPIIFELKESLLVTKQSWDCRRFHHWFSVCYNGRRIHPWILYTI